MDKNFELVIRHFLLHYGKEILDETQKCKSLLKDFAKGEFRSEIDLFMQTIEKNFHKKIIESNDFEMTAGQLIRQLQTENFISEDAAQSIVALWFLILKNYNIKRQITTQPAQPQISTKNPAVIPSRKDGKKKITPEMVEQSYIMAKKFYQGEITLDQAAVRLENSCGMAQGSAKIYILNFKSLYEGNYFNRFMKADDMEYYIRHIYEDFGEHGLRNALSALNQHIDYLEIKKIGSPVAMRRIYDRYNAIIGGKR
jgi:hypothetical protein